MQNSLLCIISHWGGSSSTAPLAKNYGELKGRGTPAAWRCGAQGDTLVVANVGDSNAVLGSDDGDAYCGRVLSRRHCGSETEEAVRLREDWGAVVSVNEEDGYVTVEKEGRLKVGGWVSGWVGATLEA